MKLSLSRVLARVLSLFFRADQDELPIEECVDLLYLRYITLLNNVFNLSPFFSGDSQQRCVWDQWFGVVSSLVSSITPKVSSMFSVNNGYFLVFVTRCVCGNVELLGKFFFCSWFHIQWDRLVLAVKENGKLMNETTRGNHRLWGCIQPSPL